MQNSSVVLAREHVSYRRRTIVPADKDGPQVYPVMIEVGKYLWSMGRASLKRKEKKTLENN